MCDWRTSPISRGSGGIGRIELWTGSTYSYSLLDGRANEALHMHNTQQEADMQVVGETGGSVGAQNCDGNSGGGVALVGFAHYFPISHALAWDPVNRAPGCPPGPGLPPPQGIF
jgi:hypothetical protein